MLSSILFIFGAYILGSLPVVYLIGRSRGYDLRQEEDMHLSLWRKVGHAEGFIGILWELLKGAGVVIFARFVMDADEWSVACAGLATVVGQMWAVFDGFRGEKGNSTGFGMMAILAYQAVPFVLIPVLTGVIIKVIASLKQSDKSINDRIQFSGVATRAMPLGMIGGFIVFPLASWALNLDPWISLVGLILLVLILVKRVTAGLMEDFSGATDKKSIVINRLLYDRSYR
ncbi:MAG: glycerol-3-phosphate acyltransferase [Chloroflexota bacterium]|nr:glycerol-3-phosphate acyltransferase [Chloroflexota bacterium]